MIYINTKKFLSGIVIISAIGSFYVYNQFKTYLDIKNSTEFQSQVADIENQINFTNKRIQRLQREYNMKKGDLQKINNGIIENYMSLIKELRFIKRNNPIIQDISIRTDSGPINKFKDNPTSLSNGLLLTEQLKEYEENPNVKKLDLNINIILNTSYGTLNSSKTNFLVYYKPLAYIYYVIKNKPAIIKSVILTKNSYNIKITLIGKK